MDRHLSAVSRVVHLTQDGKLIFFLTDSSVSLLIAPTNRRNRFAFSGCYTAMFLCRLGSLTHSGESTCRIRNIRTLQLKCRTQLLFDGTHEEVSFHFQPNMHPGFRCRPDQQSGLHHHDSSQIIFSAVQTFRDSKHTCRGGLRTVIRATSHLAPLWQPHLLVKQANMRSWWPL